MNGIEPVAFLPALQMPTLAAPQAPWDGGEVVAGTAAVPTNDGFGRLFGEQLGALNAKLVEADRSLQDLASGEPVNLHQVMMTLEDAKLSLQLVLQVRNRLVDAYSELLRMQV
ncbi:flagellar hook-basal body complex protein FliE [Aquabacterium humicola]|uniref:flagellar hook-basal body complex protein FliE n=1 Tax=Aquabacterium humicola TaxID=3237377 RepID=UPI00254292A7|nr:flagellar hook-basal body complex protein FliE [Rubrivivax pictus]